MTICVLVSSHTPSHAASVSKLQEELQSASEPQPSPIVPARAVTKTEQLREAMFAVPTSDNAPALDREDMKHLKDLQKRVKFEEKTYIDHLEAMMEDQAEQRKQARTSHNIEV